MDKKQSLYVTALQQIEQTARTLREEDGNLSSAQYSQLRYKLAAYTKIILDK